MKLQLARNACANLLGAAIPAAVALGTVPLTVHGLGDAGYGVYALLSAIVGYFAIIDINVSAGSVKHVAAFHARGAHDALGQTIGFGLLVYGALGLVGGVTLWFSAAYLVHHVFAVPATLAPLATATLQLAAFGFFAGQIQCYLDSVPQSLMRFDCSARLDVFFGSVVPLLTVGVLLCGHGLYQIVLLRIVASTLHAALLWRVVRRLLPQLRLRWPSLEIRRSVLHFSAFACLSRFAAMSYAYADKLMVGALVGVAGLAVFAVAATLANRLLGLTGRLASVLFPAASALTANNEQVRLARIYLQASRYLTYANAAMLLLVAVFAEPVLRYWISPDFARQGAAVLTIMALSQCVDALTALPSLVNDGAGHPQVSGAFALIRALLGLGTVYLGIVVDGIEGAAWGHLVASVTMTTAFLLFVHGRTVPVSLRDVCRRAYGPSAVGLAAIGASAWLAQRLCAPGVASFIVLAAATACALALYGVMVVAAPADRARARGMLRSAWS